MGDGIGDTEKIPTTQRGRLAGAIGATGGQRPDYWGILPQGVREYGEFLRRQESLQKSGDSGMAVAVDVVCCAHS